jgi:hypothetical protein
MSPLRAFGAFWWNFVIGDDWRVAAGVAAGIGLTALLAHRDLSAWWVLPATVAILLVASERRAARASA